MNAARTGCDHPRPGQVLFLADPYCWYSNPDVRKYLTDPAYAAEMTVPCPSCAAEAPKESHDV